MTDELCKRHVGLVASFSFLTQARILCTHLFNQPVAENAEMKHLSQGIAQITHHREGIHIDPIDFGGLIGEQGQHDGRYQHVQQQGSSVRIPNGSHQPKEPGTKGLYVY